MHDVVDIKNINVLLGIMERDELLALHHRIERLKERMEAGKLRFFEDVLTDEVRKSFEKVRFGADGIVILATVDSTIRSLASAISALDEREELKKLSLSEIQHTYFNFVESNFGDFYKEMLDRGSNPHEMACFLSSNEEWVKEVNRGLPEFMERITEFWKYASESSSIHLQDSKGLKAVFGGDLFPSYTTNIASTCGIYVDTVILPEPFTKTAPLFGRMSPEKRSYYIVKHALNILQYKELALTDITPPIVAVLPQKFDYDEAYNAFIENRGKHDTVLYASKMLGKNFSEVEDVFSYLKPLSNDEIIRSIKDKDLLLLNVDSEGSEQDKIIQLIQDLESSGFKGKNSGEAIASNIYGRMVQANDLQYRTLDLGGTALIDAPTSWQYYNQKLVLGNQGETLGDNNLHIAQALRNASESEFFWLGNIPTSDLIRLRQTGAIHELRHILGKGVNEIAIATPQAFKETSKQVIKNIENAIVEHQTQLRNLMKQDLKFLGFDFLPWIVKGSVGIAAAVGYIPSPYLAVPLVAGDSIGIPSFKDLLKKSGELIQQRKTVRQSPTAFLFNAAKSKTN